MVPKNDDDELPPEVQAEVDAALKGGDEPGQHAESEAADVPAPKLSRRQQAEQERMELIRAATTRAEAAEKIAEDLRKGREEDRERLARMEQAIQFVATRPAPEPQREQRRDEGPSFEEQLRKLEKDRKAALSGGDIDSYEQAGLEIIRLHSQKSERAAQDAIANFQRQNQPQQQFQKPPWVTAVESQYGDVMIHPSGTNTVAAFVQLGGGQVNPEALDKAFKRAREELGLAKKADEKNQQQRQVLAGGGTNGIPKNGSRKEGGSVKMPAGWQDAARKAGMSLDDYKRAHIAMHPEDVVRE